MTEFASEYEEVRTILNANYANPDRIGYPGSPIKPSAAWDEWLDVDHEHGGQPPIGVGGPVELLDFGGNTMRTSTLDIAICRKQSPGADHAARTTADAILAYAWTDTTTTTYRTDLAYFGRSGTWQDIWWRQDLLFPIWREDAAVAPTVPTANQQLVTQASHGFDNEWVGLNGSTFVVADSTYEAVGFAVNVAANSFLLTTDGPLTWTSHGLTVGSPVYLHTSTDGGSQSTEPSPGQRYQRLGYAIDANTIIVRVEPMAA